MVSNSLFSASSANPGGPLSPARQRDVLHALVVAASIVLNGQLDAFAERLSAALLAGSDQATGAKDANLGFNAGNLLKKNTYPFYHIASAGLRGALQDAVDSLDQLVQKVMQPAPGELRLVPFEEMENRLLLDRAARPIDIAHAEILSALNLRIAALLGREQLSTAENPFRPAVVLAAMDRAWREFDPHPESHHLMLLHTSAGVFLEMGPVLQAVNDACIAAGILPHLTDKYQIRKSAGNRNQRKELATDPKLMQQLRRLFASEAAAQEPFAATGCAESLSLPTAPFGTASPAVPGRRTAGDALRGWQPSAVPPMPISPALSAYLADLQKRLPMQPPVSGEHGAHGTQATHRAAGLSQLKHELHQNLPRGGMTAADETTVDVMSRIFEAVFRDPNIPQEMKDLIGYLQIPVLKAALIDKEFFFEDAHPARRLISLLTTSSVGWDQSKGRDDPLYQAISRNVSRVQQFDNEVALFSEVVADLEAFLNEEDSRSAVRLAAPITQALKQEKLREATRSATNDVAVRVATGEVVTFVEAFLESRWVPVLALAHSVKDEKPQVLESALKTMDELIWSVQPKITVEQRKELVAKLPALLATLNKWLNVLKWEDADRLQFFADLAECHASIVRAPLELSPHRQLELAVEAAKKAAERRLEKRAAQPVTPAPEPDPVVEQVEGFERGMWFAFKQSDTVTRTLKLAWVSPLKSLYIFTTVHREEAFSLPADVLVQNLRDGITSVVEVDGFVNRALVDALDESEAQSQPAEALATPA